MHDFGHALENDIQKFLLFLSYFGFHYFGDNKDECIDKLAVDNLLADSIRKGDEACFYNLLAFILCISEVVVELNYFFKEHEDILRLRLLLFGEMDLLCSALCCLLVDLQF